MTPNQREVLESLAHLAKYNPDTWWRPLDFGGTNGSNHGLTASRIADAYGWVEYKFRGYEPGEKRRFAGRGSKLYRITEKGKGALAADREMRKARGDGR